MVDMRVREDYCIQILDRDWKSTVLLSGFLTLSLKHPAIERNGVSVDVQEMAGTGDLTSSTDKGYLQMANLPLRHHAETGL
jgi:hypothetical protein